MDLKRFIFLSLLKESSGPGNDWVELQILLERIDSMDGNVPHYDCAFPKEKSSIYTFLHHYEKQGWIKSKLVQEGMMRKKLLRPASRLLELLQGLDDHFFRQEGKSPVEGRKGAPMINLEKGKIFIGKEEHVKEAFDACLKALVMHCTELIARKARGVDLIELSQEIRDSCAKDLEDLNDSLKEKG